MADGFQGISLQSRKSTVIQTPIGFFGISVSLSEVVNLYVTLKDVAGRPWRNTQVTAENTTSDDPRSKVTDQTGSVALVADSDTLLTVKNGKHVEQFQYDRTTQGNQIELILNIPLII